MNEVTNTEEASTTEAEATDPKQVVIVAVNPTAEEMATLRENITASYDFNVDVKPVKFNFKKSKDKETGIETLREAVELAVPYPSVEGILAILEAPAEEDSSTSKQLELLMDAMADVVNAQARDIISEDVSINAANFPLDKLSWLAIANMPKAQRRGGGITKEVWGEFAADYLAVMPTATGKTVEQITNAAKILQNKLAQVKTNEPVLKLLVEQLAIYVETSESVEDYKECVEFLLKKADTFLNASPEELLANL